MTRDDVQTLFAYNRWANQRVIDGCRTSTTFDRPAGGSFGSIKETLAHLAWAEWIWLERWNRRSPRQSALTDTSTLDAIALALKDIANRQQRFIESLSDDQLSERIAYQNLKGETWEYTLGHMMQHVVNHSTYHRGQIITLLRQAGNSRVSNTDFLAWFDMSQPGS